MLKNGEIVPANIFRAYDIRGIVNEELTPEILVLIGKAIGSLVKEQGEHQIALARDGRESGQYLLPSLCQGLISTGCDVIDLGMVPTPLLYYATNIFEQHSGVMLTGSHNPPAYNGVKTVIRGASLSEQALQDLYHRIRANRFQIGDGAVFSMEISDRYINHIAHHIKLKRPLKLVIDAGNGITSCLAPKLFRALGCEVHELYCEIDGSFPNHDPDPSQPENLRDLAKLVTDTQADLGLAFDGDGDRIGVVTNEGEIIYSDRLLIIFALDLLIKFPEATIIYDVKCTQHLETMIKKYNGKPIMWKTGHSLIKAKLAETKAKLAGEMSGHFFFNDRWYGFDDALYAGARLLEILANQNESAAALFSKIPNSVNTPELKIPINEAEKFDLVQQLIERADFRDALNFSIIDGIRVQFNDGWGLLRPSNTTPYLILRFEAVNEMILKKIQTLFKTWLLSVKADLKLPF